MENNNEQPKSSVISPAELKAQQIEAGREVFMAAVGKIVETEDVSFSAAVPKAAQLMSDIIRGDTFQGSIPALNADLKLAAVAAMVFAKDKWGV